MKSQTLFKTLKKSKSAVFLIFLISLIFLLGLYAPFLASSKPFIACYKGQWFFPFFRFLFYQHAYTKPLDLFFNALMFTLPISLLGFIFKSKKRMMLWSFCLVLQGSLFFYSTHSSIGKKAQSYAQIDQQILLLNKRSLFLLPLKGDAKNRLKNSPLTFYLRAPIQYHWQQNALSSNSTQLRVNGQSLWASLLFGIRYSFALALVACSLAFLIGVLVGALAGFRGGKIDWVLSRGIEILESLPTLLVLLFLVSLLQEVHLLWVASILAFFSWTPIARLVRLEMLKQKSLPYVEVLKNMEMSKSKILFKHLLPNCYWMLLSLMPHALIGAITYESALSFLGLGDRSSCSIGLLLDEARMAYPMQAELFWPPALLLMALLILLTWLGDTLRKVLDPKLNENSF